MEMNGQLHALTASPLGEERMVPTRQEAGWVLVPVWMQWQREKISVSARN